jgi:hypothetical protein
MWSAAVASALGLALLLLIYQSPPGLSNLSTSRFRFDLTKRELALSILSGTVWTFYNMGLIVPFGPAWLVSIGHSPAGAGALVSTVSWVVLPAIPLGALVAERLRQPMLVMHAGFALAALCIWALPAVGGSLALLAAIGIIFGPPLAA